MPNAIFDNYFIFWDVESTSKEPTQDDIISMGGVMSKYNNTRFTKISEFHTYVNTPKSIDPEAEAIHHISRKDIAQAPTFAEAVLLFENWILSAKQQPSDRIIFLAHNGRKFDDVILFCNFVQNRLNFDDFLNRINCYGFVDTLKMLRVLFKNKPLCDLPKNSSTSRVSFALGNCYSSFCKTGVLTNAHDALVDSQALFDVFNSVNVCSLFDTLSLFQHVIIKEKSMKWIKQTAGIAFQSLIDHVKEQPLDNQERMTTDPCWEELSPLSKSEARLCLNCMNFYRIGDHFECTLIRRSQLIAK
jgi:DNA polymerase III epsilon subunit-like protein